MKSFKVIEFGQPLQKVEAPNPVPQGTEVLVRITASGVCHSDVHLWEGFFDMGGGKKLPTRGVAPPKTLGHEMVGVVEAIGPDAKGVKVGEARVVYPWIGCGKCWLCQAGNEHLCAAPQVLGINRDGGFADHVLVPHPRYLFDYQGVPTELACTYACSGITAFSAIKKVEHHDGGAPILIVGAGGVGMMGVQFAKALLGRAPIVADIDDRKLALAKEAGAAATVNSKSPDAGKELRALTGGGVMAAVDFVGAESSAAFGFNALRTGGKLVIVGLFGGSFTQPVAMFPMTSRTVQGSMVGSPAEMEQMMGLARAGKIDKVPLVQRKLDDADAALQDLRKGLIMGRAVLIP
jgi:D-arabinose 1-dehydrogenase-like Zn-dependent alcohol dehydrogenase